MNTRGYGSYRGRTPFKRFGKVILFLFILLILICTVVGLYLQQFLVISDDGVRLDLPFSQAEDTAAQPSPSLPAVVVPVTPTPTPTPTPEPPPEPPPASPVLLPAEALYDSSALTAVQAAGGDCALFDMKTNSGALQFISSHQNAVNGALNPDDASRNAAIQAMNETDGLYTVARVSCFKDHDLILYDYNLAIHTNSGYRWTDPEGIRWSSPTNPSVRDYVSALCVELAQLGFDEILLDNAGYPTEGNLHYIKKGEAYDASRFSEIVTGFYSQIKQALSEYDVTLSVVTRPDALSGADPLSGQTPENLALADRLWTVNEAGLLLPVTGSSSTS